MIKLVQKAQAAYWDRSDAELTRVSVNHRAAVQALVGYESICRPAEIRALIRDGIGKAEVVADIEVDNGVQLAVVGLLARMAQVLGVSAVAEDEAVALYARYLGLATDPVQVAGNVVTDAQTRALAPLTLRGDKVGRRWNELVEKDRARKQAKAAAAEKTTEAASTAQGSDATVKQVQGQLATPTALATRSLNAAGQAVVNADRAVVELRSGNTTAARVSVAKAQRAVQQATVQAQAAGSAEQAPLAESNAAARQAAEQVKAAVEAAARVQGQRRSFTAPVLSVR